MLLCTSGFNPIQFASSSWRTSLDPIFNPVDVLVEDALVGSAPDTGDTVEAFTDFIDRLLTQVDSSPSGVLGAHTTGVDGRPKRTRRELHAGSPVSPLQLPASGKVPLGARSSIGNNGGGPSRKNKPQRCSICKEWGHKSRTCRLAPGRASEPHADGPSLCLDEERPW